MILSETIETGTVNPNNPRLGKVVRPSENERGPKIKIGIHGNVNSQSEHKSEDAKFVIKRIRNRNS